MTNTELRAFEANYCPQCGDARSEVIRYDRIQGCEKHISHLLTTGYVPHMIERLYARPYTWSERFMLWLRAICIG